jgi:hypothetical protein
MPRLIYSRAFTLNSVWAVITLKMLDKFKARKTWGAIADTQQMFICYPVGFLVSAVNDARIPG